jgi:hypothetical protein
MRVGIAVAVLLAAAIVAGLGIYYYRVGRDLDDIRDHLVTEEQLETPDAPETTSGIRLAPIQCARVYDLRANPLPDACAGTRSARCGPIANESPTWPRGSTSVASRPRNRLSGFGKCERAGRRLEVGLARFPSRLGLGVLAPLADLEVLVHMGRRPRRLRREAFERNGERQ